MIHVVINPGSGPVSEATRERAAASLAVFIEDLGLSGVASKERPEHDGGGRFGFVLRLGERTTTIRMPGWPVERVRFLGPGQNAWDFPRLYVDGSSWLWCFALTMAKRDLEAGETPSIEEPTDGR